MADHWWPRPGRRPGRELYHWHMLLHDQPAVRAMAAAAQERLAGLPGLDPVAPDWLHLTAYIVGFADEVPARAIATMISEARELLAGVAPITVGFGRVWFSPQAVVLPAEPIRALDPVLDAVRTAARRAGCEGHHEGDPWLPHVSVAYGNGDWPAEPVIAALGRRLPPIEVDMRSVSLVAQTQVGRSWQWRPVAEVPLAGRAEPPVSRAPADAGA